jgi:metal-responsive CopG/Arc/MetJ family transcriptional regulator
MADSQRVNITVPEAMYEEWKQAVEQEGVASSISELVRVSVNRNLDDALRDRAERSQEAREGSPLEGVLSYLQRMDSSLSDVQERLERLESEARTGSQSEGVNLQKVLHNHLPRFPLPPDVSQEVIIHHHESGDIRTAKDLAQQIDADYVEVIDALIKVEPRDPDVVSTKVGDGTTYWWREG